MKNVKPFNDSQKGQFKEIDKKKENDLDYFLMGISEAEKELSSRQLNKTDDEDLKLINTPSKNNKRTIFTTKKSAEKVVQPNSSESSSVNDDKNDPYRFDESEAHSEGAIKLSTRRKEKIDSDTLGRSKSLNELSQNTILSKTTELDEDSKKTRGRPRNIKTEIARQLSDDKIKMEVETEISKKNSPSQIQLNIIDKNTKDKATRRKSCVASLKSVDKPVTAKSGRKSSANELLSNTNRSFEGKENKNETLNGVNSDTDKLNLSLQLPSVENKPKRRLTAINAALNLGSAKLPKKQLQIERLKIKNMDPEEKAKLFDECNKQDEIIKMEYSQATAKTKEKKQKKRNIRLDSHESSSENLNSKKRRISKS
jgi:hypothetical protein